MARALYWPCPICPVNIYGDARGHADPWRWTLTEVLENLEELVEEHERWHVTPLAEFLR